MSPIPAEILLLAENSNTYTPLGPSEVRIVDPRYVVYLWGRVTHPAATVVQRLRLSPENVEETVAAVRALLAERGRPASTWEVGNSATPPGLAGRLLALGMEPYEEPLAVGMVLLETPPPVATDVAVRKVETLDEYLAAIDIANEAFGMSERDREEARADAGRSFRERKESGRVDTFLAWLDGEPVAVGWATYADAGVVLNGGSTLPRARGRGAYRALVAARWEEAARRGTPALITQAGAMSRPILRRLGFQEVAEIRILLDDRRAGRCEA